MVGILVSFWETLFSGTMFASGSVTNWEDKIPLISTTTPHIPLLSMHIYGISSNNSGSCQVSTNTSANKVNIFSNICGTTVDATSTEVAVVKAFCRECVGQYQGYTPEDERLVHLRIQAPWKNRKSSSKPSFSGSMLIFGGGISKVLMQQNNHCTT